MAPPTEDTYLLIGTYRLTDASVDEMKREIAKNWGWLVVSGMLNLFIGFWALACPNVASAFAIFWIGLTLMIVGLANMAGLWYVEKGLRTASFILGLCQVGLGILALKYPFESLAMLTIFIAIVFMSDGLYRILLACSNRERGLPHWGWTLANGVASIAFSCLVLSAFPMSSLFTIGILVGVNLISLGIARIVIGMEGRKIANEQIESGIGAVTAGGPLV